MNATRTAASGRRVFGYGRVSTGDQTNDNQRMELQQAGYEIPPRRWFEDKVSGSAAAAQRPGFATLMDKLDEGDTLVVSKLDRLGRDALDIEQTLEALEALGVSVVVLQLGSTDLTSTAGKLIRRILGAVAAMERDLIVERTQAGLARAKAEGKQLGRPASTSPEQREEIRRRYAEGDTVSALARDFGVSRGTVLNVVKQGD